MTDSRFVLPTVFGRIVTDFALERPMPKERMHSRQPVPGTMDPTLSARMPAAFAVGYADGATARKRQASISLYVRVARDEYADGFRSGYFSRSPAGSALEGKDSS